MHHQAEQRIESSEYYVDPGCVFSIDDFAILSIVAAQSLVD